MLCRASFRPGRVAERGELENNISRTQRQRKQHAASSISATWHGGALQPAVDCNQAEYVKVIVETFV